MSHNMKNIRLSDRAHVASQPSSHPNQYTYHIWQHMKVSTPTDKDYLIIVMFWWPRQTDCTNIFIR